KRWLVGIAQAPFPHISTHIHHSIWRCPVRKDSHRAALPNARFIGVSLRRVEIALVGIYASVRPARRFLPFVFRRQSHRPFLHLLQIVTAPHPPREPAAERHRLVPAHHFTWMVGEFERLLFLLAFIVFAC